MWFESLRFRNDKPLVVNLVKEPTRDLRLFISFNGKGNYKKNILTKIDKFNTKLDVWKRAKI